MAGLFGSYRGTVLIDDDTPIRMAEPISRVLAQGSDFIDQALADRERLVNQLSWDRHVEKRCLALRAALAERNAKSHRIAA